MKVFISWSGSVSGDVAKLLKEWLPQVVHSIDPFLSFDDIEKGARWNSTIAENLQQSNFGIICLTQENLNSHWLMFESGAIAKQVEKSKVCPLLLNITPEMVPQPLQQFQATKPTKEEIRALVESVNNSTKQRLVSKEILDRSFEKWWSEFESKLQSIMESAKKTPAQKQKSETELKLDEIVSEVRGVNDHIARLGSLLHSTILEQVKFRPLFPGMVDTG
jgi:hypothetical protein